MNVINDQEPSGLYSGTGVEVVPEVHYPSRLSELVGHDVVGGPRCLWSLKPDSWNAEVSGLSFHLHGELFVAGQIGDGFLEALAIVLGNQERDDGLAGSRGEFDSGVPAFDATFTVTVIGGKLSPPFSASLRVQLLAAVPGHVHPVPAIDTSVIPDGTVSVTVTVPLVGPAPVAFDTVTVYVAPFCPCVKLPA